MKITVVIAALLMAATALAAPKAPRYTPLPAALDGTMMPLDTAAFRPIQAPDSLVPFYAGYVARHGARYLSSPRKVSGLKGVIEAAEKEKVLSAFGREFSDFLAGVESSTAGRWGLLSPVGEAEQDFLGHYLITQLPTVFAIGSFVEKSSYVPRVVETMYGLNTAVLTRTPWPGRLAINASEGSRYDTLTRFFEVDKAYKEYLEKGYWRAIYGDFVTRHVPVAPARRLFGKTCPLKDDDLRVVTLSMYDVVRSLRCSGLGEATTQWMSEEEYRACWEAMNLEKYLCRSWTSASDEPARAAIPLMAEVIRGADEAVSVALRRLRGEKDVPSAPSCNMIFGHAETLLPLLSLMNVGGGFTLCDDYDRLPEQWRDNELTPMGANLLMVLYTSKSGNVFAQLVLNGRTVEPLRDGRRIVPYALLRNYWLSRAKALVPAASGKP